MAGMLGYRIDEMQGKSVYNFAMQKDHAHLNKLLDRRQQGINEQHEFIFLHKDGSQVFTLVGGTPLFDECRESGWLKTLDWAHYDMKEPVMKTPIPDEVLIRFVQGIYNVAFNPEFVYNRLKTIEDIDDLLYLLFRTLYAGSRISDTGIALLILGGRSQPEMHLGKYNRWFLDGFEGIAFDTGDPPSPENHAE